MKFMMKRAVVVIKMDRLEMAIAGLVGKKKNAITRGIAIPPPPMPEMLHNAITIAKTTRPQISRAVAGKTLLCEQMPSCLTPHKKYGYSRQSVSTVHVWISSTERLPFSLPLFVSS